MQTFQAFMDTLSGMSWTQYVAVATGIIYVVLAARDKIACWYFGIVSCALIAFDDFTRFRLYADGVLQIIYIFLGVAGLWQWRSGGQKQEALSIHIIPLRTHGILILAGTLISIPLGYVLNTYTDAAFSFLDTLTTVFSLIATGLLIRKVLGNWIYWIVIDAVYVYLFIDRGGVLIGVLFGIYTIVAIQGYLYWKEKYFRQRTET